MDVRKVLGRRGVGASIAAVFLAVGLASASPAAADFTYKSQFGTSGPGTLDNPYGLAVSPDGASVYVSDHGSNRIVQFSSDGTFLRAWGGLGTAHGKLDLPDGLAVDSSGNVYVADCHNNRVQKFSSTGTFLAAFGKNGGDGTSGTADGQFACPEAVAIDPAGNMVIADAENSRVQVLSPAGTFLRKFGSNGTGDGQFSTYLGLATDSSGNIYVNDDDNGRIQKFTSAGAFVRKWGGAGTGDGQFESAETISVDPQGMVWVSDDDSTTSRVSEFTPDGVFVAKYGKNGGAGPAGSGDGEFSAPEQMGFSPAGCGETAYVADYDNNRVQSFAMPSLSGAQCQPAAPAVVPSGGNPVITPAAAVISSVTQSAKRWRAGSNLATISRKGKKPPVGTTFKFTLDRAASVTFKFLKSKRGRRAAGHCVAQSKRNKKKKACKRFAAAGTLSFTGHAGVNTVRFEGRLPAKKLGPGRYKLVITAASAPGLKSAPKTLQFTIAK